MQCINDNSKKTKKTKKNQKKRVFFKKNTKKNTLQKKPVFFHLYDLLQCCLNNLVNFYLH